MKFSRAVLAGILSGVLGQAQVPEIYSIHPPSARAGEVVAIRGQDFDPSPDKNFVHFGGVKAKVLESRVTELRVEVPRGVQPGPVTVVAGRRAALSPVPFFPRYPPNGTNVIFIKNSVIFWDTFFRPAAAAADMDGDGDAELLVTTPGGNLSVYEYVPRQKLLGESSFVRSATLALPDDATLILPVDLDADGRVDILVRSPTSLASFCVLFRALTPDIERISIVQGVLQPRILIDFIAQPNQALVLQGSADLVTWRSVLNLRATLAGRGSFETSAAGNQFQFFRAALGPALPR